MTPLILTAALLILAAAALRLRSGRGGFRISRRRRYRLPSARGETDLGFLRLLTEFAVILALLITAAFLFLGAEPPRW
jgi:hypothetical protein